MNKKKIIAFAGIVLCVLIVLNIVFKKEEKAAFVVDKSKNVKIKDIKLQFKKIDFNEKNTKECFSDAVINRYTVKFFKSLQVRFKEFNFNDHLEEIKKYLYSVMSPEDAEAMFLLYKKYVSFESDIAGKVQQWGVPTSTKEALDILLNIQKYQKEVFGDKTADTLFGAELKAKEYPIRRNSIVGDKELYGAEKEAKLKELNEKMWGDEAGDIDNHRQPFDSYREKVDMYEKDLAELSEEEKKEKITEFRSNYFTPQAVKRMQEVDSFIEKENKSEAFYMEKETKILNDSSLTDEKKSKAVRELQEQIFGEKGAEVWRKRETIRQSLKQKK